MCVLLTTQTVNGNFITGGVHSTALVLPVPLTLVLNEIHFFFLLNCKSDLIILLLFCMLESGDWSLWVSSVLFTAHRSGTEVTIVILPEIHCWTSLPQIAKSKNKIEQSK